MRSSVRAYLELVRLPNLFTAAADILAGFFYAAAWFDEWTILLRLAIASVCLYAGGVALNDVCDANRDRDERPGRPIPSGRISVGTAVQLSITLLIVGIAVATSVSMQTCVIATALAIAIVFYDVVLKTTVFAAPTMGACRGLNFALGMYGITDWNAPALWTPIAIVWLYITCVTAFARTETRRSSRTKLVLATCGMGVAIAGLWTIRRWSPNVAYPEFMWLAGGLFFWTFYNGAHAVIDPTPTQVQRATKRMIISLVVLDACIAWSVGGLEAVLMGLFLLLPTIALGRVIRMT